MRFRIRFRDYYCVMVIRGVVTEISIIFHYNFGIVLFADRFGGYRTMWRTLMFKYSMVVSQELTRALLRQMDPVSVDNRRRHRLQRRTYTSRGPNDTWHVDGYDKLRPYGFLISGCIDGFSRRIMWLRCAHTNHDPAVIAGYFLFCVSSSGGFPSCVRTDCGTENVTIAAIQNALFPHSRSHIYGTSPGNQRIEAWWSFFRRSRSQWWIEIFEDLVSCGAFHVGHDLETDLLRYCFMKILREDLAEVQASWNMHRIRPSNGARCPAGIPDELYFLPPQRAANCLQPLNAIPQFIVQQTRNVGICANELFEEYLDYVCHILHIREPNSINECIQLYLRILPVI
jgi:hypothetical protein